MRPTKDEYLMAIANLTSQMSTCSRLHVGAVLATDDLTQFVVGYNGGAKGAKNECLHPDDEGGCGCAHAEMNAVAKATPGVHTVAYLTDSPCELCATLLVNMGVKHVFYQREYRKKNGIQVLKDAGVRISFNRPQRSLDVQCAVTS